jgi:hypothetical protein
MGMERTLLASAQEVFLLTLTEIVDPMSLDASARPHIASRWQRMTLAKRVEGVHRSKEAAHAACANQMRSSGAERKLFVDFIA